MSHSAAGHPGEQPLVSTRFLVRVTATIAVLALLTVAISIAGRWFGRHISLAGNTESNVEITLTIGRDTIALPAGPGGRKMLRRCRMWRPMMR